MLDDQVVLRDGTLSNVGKLLTDMLAEQKKTNELLDQLRRHLAPSGFDLGPLVRFR